MGTFSEVVLSFDFRADTPAEVLAAFSALAKPERNGALSGPAPELPPPVVEPTDWWEPDWREAGDEDEFEHEPWRHDWAGWVSNSMSASYVASAALVWTETGRWNLACRCSFKSWPEAIFAFLEWLGPFIDTGWDRPWFVGYILYESGDFPRPYLLWVHEGKLQMEDLNEDSGQPSQRVVSRPVVPPPVDSTALAVRTANDAAKGVEDLAAGDRFGAFTLDEAVPWAFGIVDGLKWSEVLGRDDAERAAERIRLAAQSLKRDATREDPG